MVYLFKLAIPTYELADNSQQGIIEQGKCASDRLDTNYILVLSLNWFKFNWKRTHIRIHISHPYQPFSHTQTHTTFNPSTLILDMNHLPDRIWSALLWLAKSNRYKNQLELNETLKSSSVVKQPNDWINWKWAQKRKRWTNQRLDVIHHWRWLPTWSACRIYNAFVLYRIKQHEFHSILLIKMNLFILYFKFKCRKEKKKNSLPFTMFHKLSWIKRSSK